MNRIHLSAAALTLCLASACQGGTGSTPAASAPASDAAPSSTPAARATTSTASTPAASAPTPAANPGQYEAGAPALPPPAVDADADADTGSAAAADNQPPPSGPATDLPPPAPASDVVSKAFAMNKGMTADIGPGATLTFESIVSDSRCPKDVQCVWAGEVTIAMRLKSSAGSDKFQLSGKKNTYTAQGRAIELVSYGACPTGTPGSKPLTGECATLSVTPAPAH